MQQFFEEEMIIDKDVRIPLRDGSIVVANVFRPRGNGPWPVIVNYSPYGKDVHFSEFMPTVWSQLTEALAASGSTSTLRHVTFETPDPEVWTQLGYAIVRVDSRGAGKSPGILQPNSPQEFLDACDAVEWAGTAPWSNGKVGLLGISYYASGQWMIAQHRPQHLAAIQPWQGTSDFYRDRTRQGGIVSGGFLDLWWNLCVAENQHGNGSSRFTDYFTGERNTGPEMSIEELASQRIEYIDEILSHPLEDSWYKARNADLQKIETPALVVANWGGLQVHLRGTLLGFEGISSPQKWLRIQRGNYFLTFYMPENVNIQRRFFDRYLKGIESEWVDEPAVQVAIRSADDGIADIVNATEWPLPTSTERTWFLDADTGTLSSDAPVADHKVSFAARTGSAVFSTGPLQEGLTLAGTMWLQLRLASTTEDADIFATLQAFDTEGMEISFESNGDPNSSMARAPLSQGWLRASHRRIDQTRSGFLRPFHDHEEHQALNPGESVDLAIEIWPASIELPPGSELRLTVGGNDFVRSELGIGNMGHDHPTDRPSPKFDGTYTLSTGPVAKSFLAVPTLDRVQ
ncbi:CocE/NonD family hydrolase [Rhodococcus sp. USK13]|uniref:CocE/NonD family hydrolase n=1 Tax=Rhodococcus sp. USK13 TaxID=2806442 RepID=UPI001BCEC1E0|nr:CocE/NonD family hydrolase [Rhodococcus sp. USK13]